jgi:hypothetical protein
MLANTLALFDAFSHLEGFQQIATILSLCDGSLLVDLWWTSENENKCSNKLVLPKTDSVIPKSLNSSTLAL